MSTWIGEAPARARISESLFFSDVFRYRKIEILYFTSKFLNNYELKPLIL
jgi:hypothetical protein